MHTFRAFFPFCFGLQCTQLYLFIFLRIKLNIQLIPDKLLLDARPLLDSAIKCNNKFDSFCPFGRCIVYICMYIFLLFSPLHFLTPKAGTRKNMLRQDYSYCFHSEVDTLLYLFCFFPLQHYSIKCKQLNNVNAFLVETKWEQNVTT